MQRLLVVASRTAGSPERLGARLRRTIWCRGVPNGCAVGEQAQYGFAMCLRVADLAVGAVVGPHFACDLEDLALGDLLFREASPRA